MLTIIANDIYNLCSVILDYITYVMSESLSPDAREILIGKLVLKKFHLSEDAGVRITVSISASIMLLIIEKARMGLDSSRHVGKVLDQSGVGLRARPRGCHAAWCRGLPA